MKPPIEDTEERRVMLMVRVPDGKESEFAKKLQPLVVDQQWSSDWAIRRIYLVDLKESQKKLGTHGPGSHNLFILVKATDQDTLVQQAIPKIRKSLGRGHGTPRGHILIGAMDANGP